MTIHVREAARNTFSDRSYLPEIVRGLGVTLRHLVVNLFGRRDRRHRPARPAYHLEGAEERRAERDQHDPDPRGEQAGSGLAPCNEDQQEGSHRSGRRDVGQVGAQTRSLLLRTYCGGEWSSAFCLTHGVTSGLAASGSAPWSLRRYMTMRQRSSAATCAA